MKEEPRIPHDPSPDNPQFSERTPLGGILVARGHIPGTPAYKRDLDVLGLEMGEILAITTSDDLRFEVDAATANRLYGVLEEFDEIQQGVDNMTDEDEAPAAVMLPDSIERATTVPNVRKQDPSHAWIQAGNAASRNRLLQEQESVPAKPAELPRTAQPPKDQGLYTVSDILKASSMPAGELKSRMQVKRALQRLGISPVDDAVASEKPHIQHFELSSKQYELLVRDLNPRIIFVDPQK